MESCSGLHFAFNVSLCFIFKHTRAWHVTAAQFINIVTKFLANLIDLSLMRGVYLSLAIQSFSSVVGCQR